MKKLLFTAEVFGSMAFLPLLVILQMNHTTAGYSGRHGASFARQKKEITINFVPQKENEKMGNEVFPIPQQTILLIQSF